MNTPPITELARAAVRTLPLYQTDPGDCAVDLSDNTNLWGSPPAALDALASMAMQGVARYPTLYSEPLRNQLLQYVGLGGAPEIDVMTGCGSDDVLDAAMRTFAGEGAAIAFSVPTFSMIPVLARLNGLRTIPIPFTDGFDIDAEQLVNASAQITYVCTPNNPTASAASRVAVEFVVRNAKGLVILDEAYAEFAPESFASLIRERDHLLVTRTFSKAFGLAGLRVGYGVGSTPVIRLISRARGPYKVTAIAERVVSAVLAAESGGCDWVHQHACEMAENRARLLQHLHARGFMTPPSAANFVLVPLPNAASVAQSLIGRGILTRLVKGLPDAHPFFRDGRASGLRIGIGPWTMMQPLLDAWDEVCA